MKKLYILLLLSLMFASDITYTMEQEIPEGKQKVEDVEESYSNIEHLDLLSFLQMLPTEMRALILSYIINVDNIEQVYKNISSLLKTNREAYALFQDDEFVRNLVNYLYNKFILPVTQFTDNVNIYAKSFDEALTLAISLENNSYAIERLKQLLADLGEKLKQKQYTVANFLNTFMIEKIARDSLKKVAFLVENIDPNLVNATYRGGFALDVAVRKENLAIVKYLVENGADVNVATAGEGITPLMFAARNGNLAIVKFLIANGANIDAVSNDKFTLLMFAANAGKKDIVEYLVSKGADINAVSSDKDKFTPLIFAVYARNLGIVQFLIANGANIEAVSSDGLTPLMYAVKNKQLNIVTYLVEQGAITNATNLNGETVHDMAKRLGFTQIADFLEKNAQKQKAQE